MSDTPPSALPLEGVRVLEFTHAILGPACGMVLGDLGAEVIHIEPPGGDHTRRLSGFGAGFFPFFGRNKKSLAVDIKSEPGRRIVMDLVPQADVLVENFGPGTMDRLGYGYDELSRVQPRLIYCALKGFLSGPYERRQALDEVVQMMAGLAYMTGPPGQPLRAGSSVVDIGGALFGVIGILLALREREQTGRGQRVRTGLFETTAFFMGQHMAATAQSPDPLPPMPARKDTWSVYQLFTPGAGDPVFIGITSDKHWHRFCDAFDRPDWSSDERLQDNAGRVSERHWLIPAIETLVAGLSHDEVIRRCERAQIPFSPVAHPEDLFEDPQLNHGAGLLETVFPNGVESKLPRTPIELEARGLDLRHQPPQVGEHTSEILTRLGYTEDQISALLEDRVIAT